MPVTTIACPHCGLVLRVVSEVGLFRCNYDQGDGSASVSVSISEMLRGASFSARERVRRHQRMDQNPQGLRAFGAARAARRPWPQGLAPTLLRYLRPFETGRPF